MPTRHRLTDSCSLHNQRILFSLSSLNTSLKRHRHRPSSLRRRSRRRRRPPPTKSAHLLTNRHIAHSIDLAPCPRPTPVPRRLNVASPLPILFSPPPPPPSTLARISLPSKDRDQDHPQLLATTRSCIPISPWILSQPTPVQSSSTRPSTIFPDTRTILKVSPTLSWLPTQSGS